MSAADGRQMLVNAVEKDETRIAIVQDFRLEDLHVERTSHETLVGNVYKGRVENVHASLQAAFVNIGLDRNAFLHVSETVGEGEEAYHRPQRGRPPRGRPGPAGPRARSRPGARRPRSSAGTPRSRSGPPPRGRGW